ncbi:MAG: hypothetical protein QX203_08970 [Methylococcaceae bacterium]
MKQDIRVLSLIFVFSLLTSFGIKASTLCTTDSELINNKYTGACGLTNTQRFDLVNNVTVSSIRVWYDTRVGGSSMAIALTGPNSYQLSANTVKGSCDPYQTWWCEGNVAVNNVLKAGSYTLMANSASVCSNPSGKTTLILMGCAANATYTISTVVSPASGGSLSCSPNPVTSGSSSTCTSIANSGYTFTSLSGDCYSNTSTCIVSNVTANKSVTALFTAALPDNSAPPIPKVIANQGENKVLMMSDMLLDVKIKLDPQQKIGRNADWWLFAETSLGDTFYYDVASGWNFGHRVSYQGPLFNLSSFQVLNMGGLPPGQYMITFGVDMNMNGIQDADAYLDSVQVDITSTASCTSHTNDSLDALSAVQQKFIAARGNPDLFNIGFISEDENQPIIGTGLFAYNSNIRRLESWIYNRDQTSTAIFDNGHFVEEATLGSTADIVPTQLSPSQFTSCMSRANIVALMGEPSCTINESISGRSYSYLRYNPGVNPAATVVFENGLLISVMAGYSRAYTTADLCSDQ